MDAHFARRGRQQRYGIADYSNNLPGLSLEFTTD